MSSTRLCQLGIGATLLVVGMTLASAAKDHPSTKREPPPPVVGRWDLRVSGPRGEYPSWLEVRQSGFRTLVGTFVGRTGSARPISQVEFDKGTIRFVVPPQWEKRTDNLCFTGRLEGDSLSGETTGDDGQHLTWTARRAPALARTKPPTWGEPVELFNGKDLAGWKPRSAEARSQWEVQNGALVNAKTGVDLVTEQKFTDFELHAEFRYPRESNSGIYLRGRYEVQIEDNFGQEPDSLKIGGVYGFLTPCINAGKAPGEWQTLKITLVGRVVTVVLNGERVIDRQTIPGITGGALDSDEGAPGPILLQGDHGPIEFRKLILTQAT